MGKSFENPRIWENGGLPSGRRLQKTMEHGQINGFSTKKN